MTPRSAEGATAMETSSVVGEHFPGMTPAGSVVYRNPPNFPDAYPARIGRRHFICNSLRPELGFGEVRHKLVAQRGPLAEVAEPQLARRPPGTLVARPPPVARCECDLCLVPQRPV